MVVLAILMAAVFGIAMLQDPMAVGGWYWDLGAALGFAGFAGLLFQMIPPARARETRRHERLGYWVLGVVLAHAFWFLAGDGVVRFYLRPGAPLYMWAGLVGLLVLSVLIILARLPDRWRVHRNFRSFRTVHRILGVVVVAASVWHVVMSGFYLSSPVQVAVLVLIVLGACLGRGGWARLGQSPVADGAGLALVAGAACGLFVLLRNIWS